MSLLDQVHPGWAHTGIGDIERVVPRVDAAAPAWPWLLLLLVPVAGLNVLLRIRVAHPLPRQ